MLSDEACLPNEFTRDLKTNRLYVGIPGHKDAMSSIFSSIGTIKVKEVNCLVHVRGISTKYLYVACRYPIIEQRCEIMILWF